MMTDDIPDWAIERAAALTNAASDGGYDASAIRELDTGMAFARYIAEHEEPPVDPLLIEARKIVADGKERFGFHETAEFLRNGGTPDFAAMEVEIALAALRRGVELERAKS